MISYLKGTIKSVDVLNCLILVHDIGYTVYVPTRISENFSEGEIVELRTYQYVREDTLDLYGFVEQNDLQLFTKLISVAGVGARMALAILSAFTAEDIKRAIIHGDINLLTSISGVGKKTAERIVLDLKETIAVDTGVEATARGSVKTEATAMDALVALGFSQSEAANALQGVDQTASLEDQVRQALKQSSAK